MKILITGNMGYVGPYTVRHLRGKYPDAILVGFDTGYFSNCLTGAAFLPENLLDLQVFGDVRNIPGNLLDGVDAVVHLAAISNDPMGKTYEKVTYEINHQASVALAHQAKKAGVRSFTFASSCSMYGAAATEAKTESSSLNPLTAYAKSKVQTESELKEMASDEFKVTCLRFATACGMSERLRLDLVLNDFVAGAVTSGKITILSDGSPWRPLINVKDMALAIEWSIARDVSKTNGNFLAINTGSNKWNYQVKDLAEAVAALIPGTEVSINLNAEPDKRSYRVNFDLYEKLAPHHQPVYNLRTTIEELKDGFGRMGFNDPDYRNSTMMRLKILNLLRERKHLDKELRWDHASSRIKMDNPTL